MTPDPTPNPAPAAPHVPPPSPPPATVPPPGGSPQSLQSLADATAAAKIRAAKGSVGRIVHYVLPKDSQSAGKERAAIITAVLNPETGVVQLNVQCVHKSDFENTGLHRLTQFGHAPVFAVPASSHDADYKYEPGSWHWPEMT
jgi:hypothetical protein